MGNGRKNPFQVLLQQFYMAVRFMIFWNSPNIFDLIQAVHGCFGRTFVWPETGLLRLSRQAEGR
jgi:hypothetical protein